MGQLSFFLVPMQQGYMSHLLLQQGYTRSHFVDYSCLEEFWYDSHIFAVSTAAEAEAKKLLSSVAIFKSKVSLYLQLPGSFFLMHFCNVLMMNWKITQLEGL